MSCYFQRSNHSDPEISSCMIMPSIEPVGLSTWLSGVFFFFFVRVCYVLACVYECGISAADFYHPFV